MDVVADVLGRVDPDAAGGVGAVAAQRVERVGVRHLAPAAADVVAQPVDVPLLLDLDAKLTEMDAVSEEICRRLMDGMKKAAICRELNLTPASYDGRIASIRRSMRSLNENQ